MVGMVMEHRKLSKLLSALDGAVSSFCRHQLGGAAQPGSVRIRGSFQQTGTATGRLAMDEPNLQVWGPLVPMFVISQFPCLSSCMPGAWNGGMVAPDSLMNVCSMLFLMDHCMRPLASLQTVPKATEFELEDSQLFKGSGEPDRARPISSPKTVQLNIRAAFVAPPGHVLLTADYCQVELRMMAHFSGDTVLCEQLSQPGADPFRGLAARWLGCSMDQVKPEQRTHTKHLCYGLLYGMGTMALAANLGLAPSEAMQVSDSFLKSLPGVEAWKRRVIADCRTNKFVSTLSGRRRHLPNIDARAKQVRWCGLFSEDSKCEGSRRMVVVILKLSPAISFATHLMVRPPLQDALLLTQI